MTDTEAMSISQAGQEQEEAGQEASSAQLSKAQLKRLKKKAAAAQGGEDAANGAAAKGAAANGAAGGSGGTAPEPAGAEAEDSGDEEEGAEGEGGEAAAEGAAKKKKKKKCEWLLGMLRGIWGAVCLPLVCAASPCEHQHVSHFPIFTLLAAKKKKSGGGGAGAAPTQQTVPPTVPVKQVGAWKACNWLPKRLWLGRCRTEGTGMCKALKHVDCRRALQLFTSGIFPEGEWQSYKEE